MMAVEKLATRNVVSDFKYRILPVSSAVIKDDNKYLLICSGEPIYKGKWGLPGGKIDFGESSSDTLKREVLEETGFRINNLGLFGVYFSKPLANIWVINFAYKGEIIGGKRKKPDGKEILGLGWFSLGELDSMGAGAIRTIDTLQILRDSDRRFKINGLEQIIESV